MVHIQVHIGDCGLWWCLFWLYRIPDEQEILEILSVDEYEFNQACSISRGRLGRVFTSLNPLSRCQAVIDVRLVDNSQVRDRNSAISRAASEGRVRE